MKTVIILSSLLGFSLLVAGQEAAKAPSELTQLKKSYDQAIERATSPIKKTFETELERLMTTFTKAGKLDAALAVKQELEALRTKPASEDQPTSKKDISATIVGQYWAFADGKPEGYLFDKGAKGFRFSKSAWEPSPFTWHVAKDGSVEINGAGKMKWVWVLSDSEAEFAHEEKTNPRQKLIIQTAPPGRPKP
jgi:hypothetical protein